MRVRKAKPQDKKLFSKLYKEYLEEIQETPGMILPTEQNLETIGRIFDSYVGGEVQGIVLLVAQDAVLIAGETGPQLFETNIGRIATGFGTYVREDRRKQGVATAMYERAKRELTEMGFDGMVDNIGAIGGEKETLKKAGFSLPQSLAYLDLRSKE